MTAPRDIGEWLDGLGLSALRATFEEHRLGADVLPELTDDLLKELGIPLGDRLRLMRAIRELRVEPGRPDAGPDGPVVTAKPQRRQLTVMMCDLAASTAMTQRLDAEDLNEINRAYQGRVSEVVERFSGYVARYMGDGVLVYFGYPTAHEDDAERAILAGRAVIDAMDELSHRFESILDEPLVVRVGIATGAVVVGDVVGEGSARESTVVGETPNLAARLQSSAGENQIVVSEATQRLTEAAFSWRDLGLQRFKGFSRSRRAWLVEGERKSHTRFARSGSQLSPLIGRDAEFRALLDCWDAVERGSGHAVVISGEPGIGKSRLAQGLLERVDESGAPTLYCQCSPLHTADAFHPLVVALGREAGFDDKDDEDTRDARLRFLLGSGLQESADRLSLLRAFFSFRPADGSRGPQLADSTTRNRLIETLVEIILGRSRTGAVLIEDLHWADASTLEVASRLIETTPREPMLMVMSHRPEFTLSAPHGIDVVHLDLPRLTEGDRAQLASGLARGKPLPQSVLDDIVSRTDGIPLFVEELTRTVIESGYVEEVDGGYRVSEAATEIGIPETLQDSLSARLDALGGAREIAQLGAVVGREFSLALIRAVSELARAELDEALSTLVDAGIVYAEVAEDDVVFTFRHALVQDAAYEGLLRRVRRQLHERVAAALKQEFAQLATAQPGVLARHLDEAGQSAEAAAQWQKAGQRALERSAHAEATENFTRGRRAIELVEPSARGRTEMRLLAGLGAAHTVLLGFESAETRKVFERLATLALDSGSNSAQARAIVGLLCVEEVAGDIRSMEPHLADLATLAEREPRLYITLHELQGHMHLWSGRLDTAREELEKALGLYDPSVHRPSVTGYWFDQSVVTRCYLAWTLWSAGKFDEARASIAEAQGIAEEMKHPSSTAFALDAQVFLATLADDHDARDRFTQRLREHAAQFKMMPFVRLAESWKVADRMTVKISPAELEEHIASVSDAWRLRAPLHLTDMARALVGLGRFALARRCNEAAWALVEEDGTRFFEVEARLGDAEVLHKGGDHEGGDAAAQEALTTARESGRAGQELRVGFRFARSLSRRERPLEAQAVLRQALARFGNSAKAAPVAAARELLDSLEGAT